MQTEQQTQPVTGPEMPLQADSTPIKKQHGKRPGAGRKPDLVKRMIARLKPATALEIQSMVDIEKHIREIFTKGSLTLNSAR